MEISSSSEDIRVLNTVQLLKEIYNGTTPLKKIESANLRSKLLGEIREFQNLLFDFEDETYNDEERMEIRAKIVRQIRPAANFTAFKKWILRESEFFSQEFSQEII